MIELTHAQIKMIRSLKDKKFRDEYGLFVVEGEKLVRETLNSSYEVESVYRMEEIGENVMSRISLCATPSPVLALVRIPADRMRSDRSSCGKCGISGGLCLALDSVRDPGNMGTILRVADWFGAETVYLSPDCTDIFAPKVVQATMGSIFRVRTEVADIPELCRAFTSQGRPVYGTLLDGEDIYASNLEGQALVVMGNESNGISGAVRNEISRGLRIPSFGKSGAESLNVAVATAVTLSEFGRRQ